jgi:predicted nucleic acid-binding protein
MKLLDTNVFIYARGRPDPYKDACAAILGQARTDPAAFGLDVETLQELLEVYSRRGERSTGVEIGVMVLKAFPDPFPVTRDQIEEAIDIVKGYRRLLPRDAIHASVVRTYGLEGIVSADRGFDRVAGLTRFDPVELAGG